MKVGAHRILFKRPIQEIVENYQIMVGDHFGMGDKVHVSVLIEEVLICTHFNSSQQFD